MWNTPDAVPAVAGEGRIPPATGPREKRARTTTLRHAACPPFAVAIEAAPRVRKCPFCGQRCRDPDPFETPAGPGATNDIMTRASNFFVVSTYMRGATIEENILVNTFAGLKPTGPRFDSVNVAQRQKAIRVLDLSEVASS